jgi:hypothetical protein
LNAIRAARQETSTSTLRATDTATTSDGSVALDIPPVDTGTSTPPFDSFSLYASASTTPLSEVGTSSVSEFVPLVPAVTATSSPLLDQ